jgi:hypothetical protein
MTNEQKAQKYSQLMFEYTKLQNQVSSIKGESLEPNDRQLKEIRILEEKMRYIMYQASIL